MRDKLLLISHNAMATGAPKLLLSLARILRKDYDISFLIKRGPYTLLPQFEEIGQVHFAERRSVSLKEKFLFTLGLRELTQNRCNPKAIRASVKGVGFILSNTITNGDVLEYIIPHFKGKILTYVHELEMARSFYTNKQALDVVLKNTTTFISPTISVSENLISSFNIPRHLVSLLPYYIPAHPRTKPVREAGEKFVVGNVGTRDWRKAPDIFIAISKAVLKKHKTADIFFIWKGGSGDELDSLKIKYDIQKSGLGEYVKFEDASLNINDFFECIDILLLCSREDPYPLVVLEAANFEVPTLCFEGTGGAPDFVHQSGGGSTVPYLDIDAMAEKVLQYQYDAVLRKKNGSNAKAYLSAKHQDPELISKRFQNLSSASVL